MLDIRKKRCGICNVDKDIENFASRRRSKDGLQSHCRPCKSSYNKKRYRLNPEGDKSRARLRKYKLMLQLYEFLETKSCVDCGEADPVVLDFDHVTGNKHWNVADMAFWGCSWNLILEEIEKCEVRCANCHRRKTARQVNSIRYLASKEFNSSKR